MPMINEDDKATVTDFAVKKSSTFHYICLLVIWIFVVGCVSATKTQPVGQVIVNLRGDVQKQGLVRIDKAFTKSSIVKAGGGWGGGSVFGVNPRSFTLTRAVSGITNTWTIPFREMSDQKWRGFQFEEGDKIVVHKLYF